MSALIAEISHITDNAMLRHNPPPSTDTVMLRNLVPATCFNDVPHAGRAHYHLDDASQVMMASAQLGLALINYPQASLTPCPICLGGLILKVA